MQTTDSKIEEQAEFLLNRLSKRYKHLRKWAKRIGTNSFRLYDRDIPEIPLVFDIYGDAVSAAYYRRASEEDENSLQDTEKWLTAMKSAASTALDIPESNIFFKERRRMKNRQETGTQYSKNPIKGVSTYRDAKEGDLSFRVNLSDYLDTGLFLDSRKKRALIRAESADKKVLNLFAYTCTLSVCAAKGGAKQVDSVDLSNTYLDWGKINFAMNGLDSPSLIRSDVLQFLAEAQKQRRHWDIIILDPPSFSNSKKMRVSFDIKRDCISLISSCLSILSPGGVLYFSSNAKGFRLEPEDFSQENKGFHGSQSKIHRLPNLMRPPKMPKPSELSIKDIKQDLIDEDFKERRTPACYAITRNKV